MASRDVIQAAGEPIRFLYFPRTALVSLFIATRSGHEVEVGVIGREGVVGISVFWGVANTPHAAVVVLAGSATKMAAEALHLAVNVRDGRLHDLMLRYTHSLVSHISQTSACNRLHELNTRLPRWLLVNHDRSGLAEFPLTQDFLAQILGVRRAGVTEAVALLSQKRIITSTRGRITIVDRAALEGASCECYAIVKQSLEAFLAATPSSTPRQDLMTAQAYADAGNAVDTTIRTDLPGYVKPQRSSA